MSQIFFRKKKVDFLKQLFSLALTGILIPLLACNKNSTPNNPVLLFDTIPTTKPLIPVINEISGIADSKANPGYLWGEEDSGNPPQIYLINHNGTVQKKIYIKGVVNRDWEDMAISSNDIYIAETGDNNQTYSDYIIYKFPEPAFGLDTVTAVETIRFKYPDGSHDAEAFLIDAATKEIFIITKRDNPSKIYKLTYPYSTSLVTTASFAGALPYNGVVSAAISPDNKEIIVKTYANLYHYTRSNNESIEQVLKKSYSALSYKLEPQGEAITFANDNSGFYTLSEKGFFPSVNLYFYKRK